MKKLLRISMVGMVAAFAVPFLSMGATAQNGLAGEAAGTTRISTTNYTPIPGSRHDPVQQFLKHLKLVGFIECKKDSDCDKGEICCKVSGLETYCAAPDECYTKR